MMGMKLTDDMIATIRGTGKAQKHSDGGGLYLYVSPAGGKFWRINYRFDGKQKTLSIGAYPAVSLEDARAKRAEAKKLQANGLDPSEVKQGAKWNSHFAAEIRFMRDKLTEIAQLAVKNKLSLEVSVGVRIPETGKAVAELQPIGTFVINCSGKK
jgi:hypothetical protein